MSKHEKFMALRELAKALGFRLRYDNRPSGDGYIVVNHDGFNITSGDAYEVLSTLEAYGGSHPSYVTALEHYNVTVGQTEERGRPIAGTHAHKRTAE